jgi:hypothetical protein
LDLTPKTPHYVYAKIPELKKNPKSGILLVPSISNKGDSTCIDLVITDKLA